MEVGPWRVDGKGGLKTVEGGWEEYTHMVYGACSCWSTWTITYQSHSGPTRGYWLLIYKHEPLCPFPS